MCSRAHLPRTFAHAWRPYIHPTTASVISARSATRRHSPFATSSPCRVHRRPLSPHFTACRLPCLTSLFTCAGDLATLLPPSLPSPSLRSFSFLCALKSRCDAPWFAFSPAHPTLITPLPLLSSPHLAGLAARSSSLSRSLASFARAPARALTRALFLPLTALLRSYLSLSPPPS
eukprot:1474239-Pleurochrysis_carterae.AAC.1